MIKPIFVLGLIFQILIGFCKAECALKDGRVLIKEEYENIKVSDLPKELKYKSPSIQWKKLTLINTTTDSYVLEFIDFRIDDIEICIPNDSGRYSCYHTGDVYSFACRPVIHKNLVFYLPSIYNRPFTLYLNITQKTKSEFVVTSKIRSVKSFAEYGFGEYAFLSFFYGILFCMAAYNFILYVFVRDSLHIIYVGYVVSLSFFSLSRIDGLGFQYLWPEIPLINQFMYSFSLGLFVATSIGFALHFLELKAVFPNLVLAVQSFLLVRIILGLLPLIDKSIYDFKFIDLIGLYFIIGLGLYYKKYRNVSSRFFFGGFIAMTLGFSIYVLQDYQFIAHSFEVYYALNFGVILETVLLSMALSEKAKYLMLERQQTQVLLIGEFQKNEVLQKELIFELKEKEELKDKVNKELEQKVQERTSELEEKNVLLIEQKNKIEQLASQLDQQFYGYKKETTRKELESLWTKHLAYEEFLKKYPTELSCLRFLESKKWSEEFRCVKCQYSQYIQNNENLSRKCSRCAHIESVTSNTVYHGVKFSLQKAMYLTHCVIHGIDETSASEYAQELELRYSTCKGFITKAVEFFKSEK